MPTYLITGVSSGIGLELCRQILEASGENFVYGTVRSKQSSKSKADNVSAVCEKYNTGGAERFVVLEDIDVAKDEVISQLKVVLESKNVTKLDFVIHNAGSVNGSSERLPEGPFAPQKLSVVSMDLMRAAFEVNTLSVIRVHQAVDGLLSEGGKIGVISTGFASIADNGSGGTY